MTDMTQQQAKQAIEEVLDASQAARAAYARALNRPELRATRLVLHEAYNDMRVEERRAAAAARHYGGRVDPRGLGRFERRASESEERAQEVHARWATLTRAYEAARAAALAEEGYDPAAMHGF